MKMHWERWMTETMQRGGRFVFLRDGLPNSVEQFSEAVIVSAKDIRGQICSTTPQDMVFIFESQIPTLKTIDSLLQGQRILIGAKTPQWIEAGWVDVMIPELNHSLWQEALKTSKQAIFKALPDFRISQGQPCLFLDRDDVIVKNVPYNKDPEQVVLNPGIVDLINKAHNKNWWVAMVTNQSGLGRGKITWEEYQKVHQRLLKLLAAQGAWIDECVWASHIEDAPHAAGDFYAGLRKPRPGMFQQVDEKLKVDRTESIMIGDSASDVMAAYHAGIANIYLLETDRVQAEVAKLKAASPLLTNLVYKIIPDLSGIIL